MTSELPDPPPSRFGNYTLLKRLAVGGMAEVFLAVEETPRAGRRFVTIKRIRPDLAADPDYGDFFVSEGRVSMKCSHPNLPRVYALGKQNGISFLAMEFIRGHTLLELIRSAYRAKKPLAPATAVHVGLEVAAALEHAHSLADVDGSPLQVVHRDVTPQNIMIDSSGAVKLIDFGIVRTTIQAHATRVGTIKGKFSYMAPEQLDPSNEIDRRCDIFALGICLHESLSGRSLFRGQDDNETLKRVRRAVIPSLCDSRSDVPRSLDRTIRKALERDPQRRFQNATELIRALEDVSESEGIYHSARRLRDEVISCCGEAPLPTLATEADEAETDLHAEPGSMPTRRRGIAGDIELMTYLLKAGMNLPKNLKQQVRATTHSDPELASLLAKLE